MGNYLEKIVNELAENAKQINQDEISQLITEIKTARHIFLKGAGRSGIAIQAFANRLLHLGFSVSVVGEISSPHSKERDLLIICSSSGETTSLVSLAEKASQNKLNIALVTTNKESSIGKLASVIIDLLTTSKPRPVTQEFTQPMGTSFEQLSFLLFDSIVLDLMELLDETSQSMSLRHADLE
ncbi:6-phospho-3-hexuloisomerase [Aerococcaceae bacterium WGS1372]